MYQERFNHSGADNRFVFEDVAATDGGIVSPKILPFDTPVRIDIHVEGDRCLSLEGEIFKCRKVSGGWQAELYFCSIIPSSSNHS